MDLLAERFEQDRAHLRMVAQRILGSSHEADDAVQEAWVRLSRADTTEVGNLTGWLTTVVSRVCLDMLRARQARREDAAELDPAVADEGADPERDVLMADAIGPALMLVLDTLGPSERLAFVLHDMFAVPFPEIAEIVGCSPAAARQYASRGRRRVRGSAGDAPEGDVARRRTVVEAFLAAARDGDFSALLTVLDPEVVLRSDEAAVAIGSYPELVGPRAVAERFAGGAKAARLVLLDGEPGLVWSLRGVPQVAFYFTVDDATGRVTAIDLVAERQVLDSMEVTRP